MAAAATKSNIEEQPEARAYSAFRIWQRLMGYVLRYRLWVAIALVGIIGTNILAVAVPYILRDVVDIGIAKQDSAYMLNAGLLVVGLGARSRRDRFHGPLLRRAAFSCRFL